MSQAKRVQFPRELLVPEAAVSTSLGPIKVPPGAGHSFDFGGLGVQWKIDGRLTDQLFAVVHHPLAPRALAAPLHYHRKEDELSYVVTGRLGVLLGEEVIIAHPGTWVFKPRHQWHTFWNDGDEPCEIVEIISPGWLRELLSRRGRFLGQREEAWGNQSEVLARNAIRQCARAVPTIQCDLSFALGGAKAG